MPGLTAGAGWLSSEPASGSPDDSSLSAFSGDDGQVPKTRGIHGGPPLARAITLAVLCSYVAVQVIQVVTAPLPSRGFKLAVEVASVATLFLLTVSATATSAERWPQWRRLVTLAAAGAITYFPLLVLGRYWIGMAGFFAGTALLLLPGWAAWALFAAVVGTMFAVPAASSEGAYGVAYFTLSTLLVGLVVFGLARLSLAIRYVHATRGELAQLAIIKERMRFARDLHDLLGYSLSAITLKAELTRRLVGSNPARARDELAEVLDIARQALADVRIVASGYRNISLAKEASSVNSLLITAGIDARVEINCGALDEQVDTALATVLREAVTNMLRHSTVRNCVVEANISEESIRLLVSNDGVPRGARSGRLGGGLENLRTRMEAIGGTLTADVPGDGWFTVLAEAPLVLTNPDEPASGGAGASPHEGD